MSELSRDDIRHLSRLARLELSEEEYARYAGQLSRVVDYVDQLQAVPTEGIAIGHGGTTLENVLAADQPRAKDDPCSIDPRALLTAAPLQAGNFIEVRAVLGGEEISA